MVVKGDLAGIKERLMGVEKGQQEIAKDQRDMHVHLLSLERDKEKDKDRGPKTSRQEGPRHRPIYQEPTMKQVEDFIMARRSLYFSPVEPHLANIKDFLLSKMDIPHEVVSDLAISNIRKIHPRKMPPHRQKSDTSQKMLISFRDLQERNMIVSYASNLSGDSRMEVSFLTT